MTRRFVIQGSLAVVLAFAPAGCVVETNRHYVPADGYYVPAGGAPAAQYIDTDLGVDAAPGDGVGVLVEYVHGGSWHVRTVCDTLRSGQPCNFQIYAQALTGTVSGPRGSESFGPDDSVGTSGVDTVVFTAATSTEIDGVWFETSPGASVDFTTLLDGANDYLLSFRSYGAVVLPRDAPSPVALTPTSP